MDIEYAADALWSGIKAKRHMPAEWQNKMSLSEAYAVQLAILNRRIAEGDAQAGWKVGLTSAAMRRQQGVPEPCFGYLLKSGHLPSGIHVKHGALIRPGIENELCLTLGERLDGAKVTFEEASAAIASIEPALELVEVRGDFSADIALSMADNAQQLGFITGPSQPFDGAMSLRDSEVHVAFNGQLRETASGAEVMGSPVYSVMWLAKKLSEFGLSLEAGTRIMSGSFTKQYAVGQGDTVTTHFVDFGTVKAVFE